MSTKIQTFETENATHINLSGGRREGLNWSLGLGVYPAKDNAYDAFVSIALHAGLKTNRDLAMCHLTKDQAVAWATALLDAVKEI